MEEGRTKHWGYVPAAGAGTVDDGGVVQCKIINECKFRNCSFRDSGS